MLTVLLFIWQLPQNIVGFFVVLLVKAQQNTFVTKTTTSSERTLVYDSPWGNAVSLGHFIIIDLRYYGRLTVLHESGHCVQSRLLGPLYLIVVGIPSLVRNIYSRIYINKKLSYGDAYDWYYSGYPEKQADKLAGVDRPKLGNRYKDTI